MVEIKTIFCGDENFPALLKEIPDTPEKIFVLGNEAILNNDLKIAIVGTRKASAVGRSLARKFAKELAELGAVVVSGLAMGIDSAAHEGALEAKCPPTSQAGGRQGKTIAVLANGLDKIYPAQNENLAKKILEFNGAIISEYPEDTPSFPSQFLERNRIVSGLCAATIVIEAPDRSGSLATARYAAEQGREVFVVPGPANDINYIGSHKLIRDGAILITSVEDVIEDLGIEIFKVEESRKYLEIDDPQKQQIINAIIESGQPLDVDKISKLANLEPQIVNQLVAFLVIEGILKETEKGYTI